MTTLLSDRRTFRRAGGVEHRIGFARVRPGHPVAVIDVSVGGAFIELSRQLLPGSIVDLQLDTPQRRTTLRGRVLRCAVACLASTSISYRAAIAFDHQCLWLGDDGSSEYSVPIPGPSSSRGTGVSSTPDAV
jgi:PilZ domain-containing protein